MRYFADFLRQPSIQKLRNITEICFVKTCSASWFLEWEYTGDKRDYHTDRTGERGISTLIKTEPHTPSIVAY